jgi:hypothetical protein
MLQLAWVIQPVALQLGQNFTDGSVHMSGKQGKD